MRTLAILLALITINAYATIEYDDSTIQGEHMEIGANYEKKRITPADRARAKRRRLEEHNEQLIQKKVEMVRLKREIALNKEIQQTFNAKLQALDSLAK